MIPRISCVAQRLHAFTQRRSFAIIASDSERMLRETMSVYAKSMIQPKVAEMDEKGVMDPSIIESLFEQVCEMRNSTALELVGIYGNGGARKVRRAPAFVH